MGITLFSFDGFYAYSSYGNPNEFYSRIFGRTNYEFSKFIIIHCSFLQSKTYSFRDSEGYYTPDTNAVSFTISVSELDSDIYKIYDQSYEIELFKDYFIAPNLLSTLKTNNKVVNVVGSIFAKENNYNNCLLLNTNKNVIEALNGNVFLVNGTTIKTAPLTDGCLKGIVREKLIEIISKSSRI